MFRSIQDIICQTRLKNVFNVFKLKITLYTICSVFYIYIEHKVSKFYFIITDSIDYKILRRLAYGWISEGVNIFVRSKYSLENIYLRRSHTFRPGYVNCARVSSDLFANRVTQIDISSVECLTPKFGERKPRVDRQRFCFAPSSTHENFVLACI